VQTPALLRRSGIRHAVGDSLSVHPTVKVVALFPDVVNAADMGVPAEQVKQFAPGLSFGCSISTPPYLALAMLDHGVAGTARVRERWRHMAIYYAMTTGEPAGRVRPLPGLADPRVAYPVSAAALQRLADGLGKLGRLLIAAGAQALYPSVAGGPVWSAEGPPDAQPVELPRARTSLMTVHLFASCPMGEDERRCATDSFGRVRGADGLHVADASLLCSAPGVNPQGTVMALAHRNAVDFLERG
jgi:choline dehydrogenase-like flavoprotein